MGKTICVNEKTGNDAHNGLTPETALLTREEVVSRAMPSKPTVFVVVWDGEKWRTEKETEEQSNG